MSLIEFLNNLKINSRNIYYRPNGGNAGDALINVGFFHLAEEIDLKYSLISNELPSSLSDDDAILIAGGGCIVPEWSSVPDFIREALQTDARIVVLPQSVKGLPDLLLSLREKDVLFLREDISLDYCTSLNLKCSLFRDEDTAFHINLHRLPAEPPFSAYIKPKGALRFLLVHYHKIRSKFFKEINAYRCDKEASTERLPRRIINDLSLIAALGADSRTNSIYSAAVFLDLIKSYDLIRTDRLHVMIGSILAERKVIASSNNYHKLKGVYLYSIKNNISRNRFVDYVE